MSEEKVSPTVQLVGSALFFLIIQENAILFLLQNDCLRGGKKEIADSSTLLLPRVQGLSVVLSSIAAGFFKLVFCFSNGC